MMTTVKSTAKKAVEKVEAVNEKNPVIKVARTAFLAGLGAAALGRQEVEAAVERLVEKGEAAQKDGRKMLDELMERRKKEVTKAEDRVEGMLDKRIESMLHAMNIPSKSDIEDLSRKITTLSRKVAELDKKVEAERKAPVEKKAA